jgi:hypothetical protein
MAFSEEQVCKCVRCTYVWVKRVPGRPVRCPNCKQPNWDISLGTLKRGPKPAKVKRGRPAENKSAGGKARLGKKMK